MYEGEQYLYVDVNCTECGKLMALTNAFQYENKYLCPGCAPELDIVLERAIKPLTGR
jgi:formylmethanofuran dehydrogenase subunit E